ncbi:peptidoglycan recognition protein family protein [Ruminococcus sp.]|uniref:peptidoglycan recognition protein family protein n=1 Tax=Ruminococcus sp. TaxID=41978 RepID=UPI003FD7D30F
MSNSKLVNYTKLSPNHSGARTHSIDRITPHCVVGQCSVETLGNIFMDADREASCNYGIGADGRVLLCVDEENRSWCSSSNSNDQRAVTIECASELKHPYAFNEKVYNKLVELCVDICKRNGKKKLLWINDKNKALNYSTKSDEMLLTVHRWFDDKACPGDWLYNRLGNLAKSVTEQLSGKVEKPTLTYRVYADGKWYSEVKGLSNVAGRKKQAISAVAVKVSKGDIRYRVHLLNGDWLPWVDGYDIKDDINGYAGIKGKVIDGLQVEFEGVGDYKATYRVRMQGEKRFLGWQYNGEKDTKQDGYAGIIGGKIDGLQITLT